MELANGVQLAGHVRVEDSVVLGGLAAVHQFVRIGACAFVGAGAMVSQDVPPYALVSGDRAQSYGVNTVGLRRIGLDGRQRSEIRLAFKLLYGAPTLEQGLARIRGELPESPQLAHLIAFCAIKGRGLCAPARARRHAR